MGLQDGISNHNSYPTATIGVPGCGTEVNGTSFFHGRGDGWREKLGISWGGASGEKNHLGILPLLPLKQSRYGNGLKIISKLLGYPAVVLYTCKVFWARVGNLSLLVLIKRLTNTSPRPRRTAEALDYGPRYEKERKCQLETPTSRSENKHVPTRTRTKTLSSIHSERLDRRKKQDIRIIPFATSVVGRAVLGSRLGLYAADLTNRPSKRPQRPGLDRFLSPPPHPLPHEGCRGDTALPSYKG